MRMLNKDYQEMYSAIRSIAFNGKIVHIKIAGDNI